MNISELRNALYQIGYWDTKAPAIKKIRDAAERAGKSFEDFVLSAAAPRAATGEAEFSSDWPEEEKTSKTKLAERILNSGYRGEGLENSEEIVRRLRAQLISNEGENDFQKVKSWWSMVQARWAEWMVDQEDGR